MDELARGAAYRTLTQHTHWHDRPCAHADPELFHAPDREQQAARQTREATAKTICGACPLRAACAAYAYGDGRTWWEPHGLYGGTTAAERARARTAHRRDISLSTSEQRRHITTAQRLAILHALAARLDLRDLKARTVYGDHALLGALAAAGVDRRCLGWQVSRMCTLLGVDVTSGTVLELIAAARRVKALPRRVPSQRNGRVAQGRSGMAEAA